MSASPLVQSSSKWQFLMRIGLDGCNRDHQALYWTMKSEAIRVYDAQLQGNCSALKHQYARERPPFSANQFSEEAFINAVRTIVRNACPQTRVLYDQGVVQGQPNWVARWILYHVCRYRDGRNKKAARSKNFHDDDDDKITGGPPPPPPPPPPPSAGPAAGNGKGRGHTGVYDPVRNERRW
ncbi:hypothetical protein IMSHALPRED_005326 [Imshaugia aleurites]|uniref:Uncharacterized protein n=1 Tax=Imshaugia aleurites TaxID=172621 RepID=A0A8H3IKD1_9LECA|nr:hypothetical protein IMSHALPRED_005326 [Imshaugia aleurites]